MIGLHTKVKQIIDMINSGESNVCTLSTGVYVIDISDQELGTFVYTKFESNVAKYTVRIPFSYNQTLIELLMKGDNGLYLTLPPIITELP